MPKLLCFLADLQAGSKTAVAKPFMLDDGDEYNPSLAQQWLMDCYTDAIEKVKYHAQGHDLHLKLGGDMVDGHHHDSSQVFGTDEDQEALAVELAMPFMNMAVRCDALRGTDAHTGPSGNGDRAVYRKLGVHDENIRYLFNQDYDGALLNWAHHSTAGRKPNVRGNALKALINEIYFQNLEEGLRIPSLTVRHHVHLYDDVSDNRKGMRAVTCPGWQLNTSHTRKLSPHGIASIGLVLWWPDTMKVLPILYKPNEDPIEYVT